MKIVPTPTQWRFMTSDAFVVMLFGPRGEGKTYAGYYRLLYQASRLPPGVRPLRVAIIRDTLVNLRDSTIRTLHELEGRGIAVQWQHDQGHEAGALVGGGLLELRFIGLDRMAEVNRLQGLGVGVVWLEEPAPAAELSGGIPPEVFGVAATSLRQPGVVQGWIQITMNPPDEDHWTLAVADRIQTLAPSLQASLPQLAARPMVALYRIPKGENPHYADQRRAENRLALEATGRRDLVQRLIEGQIGQVILGEPVMPEYSDSLHVAEAPLPVLRQGTLVRSWDFGLTPTCIWSQITPSGHAHVLWAVQGVNQGLAQLLDEQVLPWEADFLRGFEGAIRDVGDRAGTQREQSNSERTAVALLESRLRAAVGPHAPPAVFEPGPVPWAPRRDALKALLSRLSRGRPILQVDPECRLVRRALRGGWHYPKDALGRITPTLEAAKRASGLHDHVGHALAYLAAALFPVDEATWRPRWSRPPEPHHRPALAWMHV